MAKKGRRSLLDEWLEPENLILIEGWAKDGLTNKQIAHNIGVTPKTLCEWQNKSREFCETLKKSKEVADREVENALFKRACGYEYEEVVTEVYKTGEGKDAKTRETHVKKVKKQVAPDVGAIVFWLKNRKSNYWRDRQEIVDTRAIDKMEELQKSIHESAIQFKAN